MRGARYWTAGGSRGSPMQPGQLRKLHLLWRRWTGQLGLNREQDRELRHYYVWLVTHYQCPDTKSLSEAQAAQVIRWLAGRVRQTASRENYAAGTAGRRGYPEQRQMPPSAAAWQALWRCASALGMSRSDLESFLRRRYSRAGPGRLAAIRTMADLNRVLWGLKAMLRHRGKASQHSDSPVRHAA